MSDYLNIDHISMRFYSKTNVFTALEDVNFSVHEREFVSLIGPSGCGKSTVLRLVANILTPTEGKIAVGQHTPEEARKTHRVGFVFQSPVLLPWRTSLANIRLAKEIVGSSELSETAQDLLTLVGLSGFENRLPDQLSGGMRQRVAIARALLLKPELLLMDEPFGALDEITREFMGRELLRIWEATRATVLFVTHSVEEAVFLSDRIIVMSAHPGKIRGVIEVTLPRPRASITMETPEAYNCIRAVRSLLKEAS